MGNPQLPPDFKDFLKLFLNHDVRYMVIGGMAVIHHGYPRLTLDLDIWVEPTVENGRNIIAALKDFGFDNPDVTAEDFTNRKQILRMGFKPTMIEVFSSIPGVHFADCYQRRVFVDIDGEQVPFISLGDLRENKSASGRTKDLLDLEELP